MSIKGSIASNKILYKLFSNIKSSVVGSISGIGRALGIAIKQKSIDDDDGLYHRQGRRHYDLVSFIVEKKITKESDILDVGCGSGLLEDRLYKSGYENISGCDIIKTKNLTSITQTNIAYKQIDFDKDGLKSYPDNSFDVIVSSDVVEHLENPAFILREFSRVIKADGHIFITLPNAFNLYERFQILLTGNSLRYQVEPTGVHGHISILASGTMTSLLNRASLKIANSDGGYWWWKDHFWFPNKKFSQLFSYNAQFHLKKKTKN